MNNGLNRTTDGVPRGEQFTDEVLRGELRAALRGKTSRVSKDIIECLTIAFRRSLPVAKVQKLCNALYERAIAGDNQAAKLILDRVVPPLKPAVAPGQVDVEGAPVIAVLSKVDRNAFVSMARAQLAVAADHRVLEAPNGNTEEAPPGEARDPDGDADESA